MALMHLVRFGAEPLLAHAAHVQRVVNMRERAANPEFKPVDAAGVRALLPTVAGPVDPVLWLPAEDREMLLKEYKARRRRMRVEVCALRSDGSFHRTSRTWAWASARGWTWRETC